jgi:Uma2 family endonuclease
MSTMRRLTFESRESVTQAEFADWIRSVRDDNHYELLHGRVVMEPPAGWPHGRIEARIVARLDAFAEAQRSGLVFGSSQGFELPSGDTVEPDVAFVSAARWTRAPKPRPGKFLRVVPDLIVEILSPGTASRDRGEKKGIYESNGVREYWLVDPRAERVKRFALGDDGRFGRGAALEAGEELVSEVLPGLRVAVAEIARPD